MCVQWCLARRPDLRGAGRGGRGGEPSRGRRRDRPRGAGRQARLAAGAGHRRRMRSPADRRRRQRPGTNMETVAPFKEIIDAIKARPAAMPFKYCYQCGMCDSVCPWNRVRQLQHAQARPRGHLRPDRDRERGHLALHHLRQVPAALPARRQADRGRRAAAPDRHRVRRVPELGASRSAPSARASPARAIPSARTGAKRGDWADGPGGEALHRGHGDPVLPRLLPVSYDPRVQKVAAATAKILNKAGVDFGILGDAGELLRREHPQDRRRGALQAPGTAEHQDLHRPRREEDPRLLAALLPHLQERVPRVHGELRGGPHLRSSSRSCSPRAGSAQTRLREEGDLPRPVLPRAAQRHLRRAAGGAAARCPASSWSRWPSRRKDSLCCGGGGGRIWMETPKGERFSDLRLAQAIGSRRRGAGRPPAPTASPTSRTAGSNVTDGERSRSRTSPRSSPEFARATWHDWNAARRRDQRPTDASAT